MADKDYYKVLGVARTAADEDIKKAHRKLARKHHPDLNPGNKKAEEQFKEIQEAYDVLSDPEKRKKYDMYGEMWSQMPAGAGASGFTAQDPFGAADTAGGSINFEDIFGSIFGGGKRPAGYSQQPTAEEAEVRLDISLEDAFRGGQKRVTVTVEDTCTECGGVGQKRNARGQFDLNGPACPKCRGRGHMPSQRSLIVNIPPGAWDGFAIPQPAQGPADPRGRRGDLVIRLHILPNQRFERDGQNLLFDVQVPYTVAALGGEVPVETLGGLKRQLVVPAGIQTGQKLRLGGQGMPALQDKRAGDALARVRISVPRDLSAAEKHLLGQLAQLRNDPVKVS